MFCPTLLPRTALFTSFAQSQQTSAQYYSTPSITRYFDHVQSRPSVRKAAESLAPAFPVVALDLENAPHQERKAEPPKKKEKAPKAAEGEKAAAPSPAKTESKPKEGAKAAEGGEKELKTQKKEKKAKEPKAAEKKPADDAGEPVPSMIDLRVGHIVDSKWLLSTRWTLAEGQRAVKKHPDADGLYVEVSRASLLCSHLLNHGML